MHFKRILARKGKLSSVPSALVSHWVKIVPAYRLSGFPRLLGQSEKQESRKMS
jgi:hypothetical protein